MPFNDNEINSVYDDHGPQVDPVNKQEPNLTKPTVLGVISIFLSIFAIIFSFIAYVENAKIVRVMLNFVSDPELGSKANGILGLTITLIIISSVLVVLHTAFIKKSRYIKKLTGLYVFGNIFSVISCFIYTFSILLMIMAIITLNNPSLGTTIYNEFLLKLPEEAITFIGKCLLC